LNVTQNALNVMDSEKQIVFLVLKIWYYIKSNVFNVTQDVKAVFHLFNVLNAIQKNFLFYKIEISQITANVFQAFIKKVLKTNSVNA
jgi:hypothetical protein